MRISGLSASLLLVLTAVACGSPNPSADRATAQQLVQAAQHSVDERGAGRIEFALTASAEDSEPVGFEIEGDYSFEAEHELALLDLTYRQILGEDTAETKVVSTGDRAWVVTEESGVELTESQAKSLRVGEGGGAAAVPAFDLGGWLVDGEVEKDGASSTVAGEVRASALVADLQTISAQVAGVSGGKLDADTARQIDESVRSSEMKVETEAGSLRHVRATVQFGATVPRALRKALGQYAGATLELSMTVEDIETPLEIDPPA